MNPRKPKKRKKTLDAPAFPVVSSSQDEQPRESSKVDSGAAQSAGEGAAAFEEALRLIRGSQGSDRCGSSNNVRDSEQRKVVALHARKKVRKVFDDEFEALPLLSNCTSEHEVRKRESDGCVVKRTWPGVYGRVPFVKDGKLERREATPCEYLERQVLQIRVFCLPITFEGVNISDKPSMIIGQPMGQPSFVISQRFIEAANPQAPAPTELQIAEFLGEYGFKPKPGSYFGWFRTEDSIAIVDAKPDNFILSHEGVIPIDLQMAYVDLPP